MENDSVNSGSSPIKRRHLNKSLDVRISVGSSITPTSNMDALVAVSRNFTP